MITHASRLCRSVPALVVAALLGACQPEAANSGEVPGPPTDAQAGPGDRAGLPPIVELPPELDRVLRDYEAGWEARDAEALAGIFTEDGFVLSGGERPAVGREQILERYRGRGGPLHLVAYDYAIADSVGFIIGGYSASPDRREGGKYVLTLRRGADGRWLIHSDMDNGNGGY